VSEDLIDWLRAQIDEDEHIARKATSGDPWRMEGMSIRGGTRMNHTDVLVVRHTWPQEAEHIVRHDPARVLRAVESLRKIVDNCSDWIENPVQGWEIDRADELTLKLDVGPTLLCLLAAIFSGRPGFREEWRLQ
jgi:hypothetical protein